MIRIVLSGGFMMIPIFICAFVATFVIFNKLFYFTTLSKHDVILAKNLPVAIKNKNYDQAIEFCDVAKTPYSLVMKEALIYRNFTDDDIREMATNTMKKQVVLMEKSIQMLSTVANLSTLLGLLGTVLGNIGAFSAITVTGSNINYPSIASSISKALITTAAGLIVSIPSSFFYNIFISKVDKQIVKIEADLAELIIRLSGRDSRL